MTAVYTNFCGMVVHQSRNGIERDIIPDPLGSVAHLVDEDQNITASYTYTPYGEIESHTGEDTPLNFVGTLGYYRDTLVSKLTYIRARWYKSEYGRWMTVDPLWPGERAYGYVGLSPVQSTDPSGLQTSNCSTYVCFNSIEALFHSFTCTTLPDGTVCSGGMYPGGPDDNYKVCPVEAPGVTCVKISDSCCIAQVACMCIRLKARGGPFEYWCGGTCHGITANIQGCINCMAPFVCSDLRNIGPGGGGWGHIGPSTGYGGTKLVGGQIVYE